MPLDLSQKAEVNNEMKQKLNREDILEEMKNKRTYLIFWYLPWDIKSEVKAKNAEGKKVMCEGEF